MAWPKQPELVRGSLGPRRPPPGRLYYLDYASTNEILIEVGSRRIRAFPSKSARGRWHFQLGLTPYGKGAKTRCYWMPRLTPPLPIN